MTHSPGAMARQRLVCLVLGALALVLAACAPPIKPPVSGFRPIYPELKLDLNSESLIAYTLPTRKPTLAWEPFPGSHQDYTLMPKKPFVDIDLARVRDVTYELRIWRAVGGSLGELLYERRGLTETRHRVEEKLPGGALCFWSVRARFTVDGQPRLTEWSMSMRPDYGATARDVARRQGTIPPRNYYRFRTSTR